MRYVRGEQGMALGLVLTAIVVIGVLIASAVYMSTQDYRIAANTSRETRAAATAEYGINRILNDWQLAWNTKFHAAPAAGLLASGVGDTLKRSYGTSGGGTATVQVTRLPGPFFWVTSEGYSGGMGKQASARRRYGGLLRLNMPNVNIQGAVTTQGNITVQGNVTVNGNDANPTGWSACGPLGGNIAGAAISPTTTATVNGSVTINGNPPSLTTPVAADTNTYFNYGSQNYQSLAAAANQTIPGGGIYTNIAPVVSGSTCTTSVMTNWGEPNRATPATPCETYYPIIHVLGDIKVTGGRGQGILLVDGNITAAGNFQFTGLIVARGGYTASGTGNKVVGSLLAASVSVNDDVSLSGNTSVLYSSCALMSAFSATSYPKAAIQRGWVDLF
jgi:hypothetical protein